MANDFSGDANCVALYRFESGVETDDSIGGNDLTDHNTVGTDAVNYKEGAQSADFELNNSEYYSCDDGDLDSGFPLKDGDTNKKISVCFWFRPESEPEVVAYLFAKYVAAAGDRSFAITIQWGAVENDIGILLGYNSGNSYDTYRHGSALSTGVWYHIGVTYDDSDKSLFVKIWDDNAGAQLGSNIDETASNNIWVGDAPLTIGARGDGAREHDGNIDEVVVFKDILSEAEIDEIRQGTYGAVAQRHWGFIG